MNLQDNNNILSNIRPSYRIWRQFAFEVVRSLRIDSFGGKSSSDSISILPIMTVPNGFVNNRTICHSFLVNEIFLLFHTLK